MRLHFTRSLLLLSLAPFAVVAQERDIVDEVREASRPMTPVEKRLEPPKPFQPILPTADPMVGKFLDPAWNITRLYFDDRNEILQEVALTGLLHARVAHAHNRLSEPLPETNETDSGNRRARLGARLKAFYNTTVEADIEMRRDEYAGINDLKIRNHFNTETWISLGKMKAPFSYEWATHSSDLKVYDRSPLIAQLHPRRTVGAMVEGQITDTWGYQIGLFSGDDHREIGGLNAPFWFVGLNYDFSKESIPNLEQKLASEEGLPEQLTNRERWYLHYIYNHQPGATTALGGERVAAATSLTSGNPINSETYAYRHLVATGLLFEQDLFSLNAEMQFGRGAEANVWGLSVTPSYWIIPGRLEAVARWAYAGSDNTEGLLLNADPSRDFLFSNSAVYTGDTMHSFYLGGNYYPYADGLNLQGGVDFTQIDGPDGVSVDSWTYFFGSRLEF